MDAASHIVTTDPKSEEENLRTLSLDFGGSSVKSAVLDQSGRPVGGYVVEFIAYPFAPKDMLATIEHHMSAHESEVDRITLGMPGIIRSGRVVYTPHYICVDGPRTQVDPALADAWNNSAIASEVSQRFDVPVLALNDAEVAAAGVITGEGAEMVLTLGTGLGCAFFVDGQLAPHIEVSHAPWMNGRTFDDVINEANRYKTEPAQWSQDVLNIIDALWPVYRWDRLYLGGGNAQKLTTDVRKDLANHNVTFLEYEAGAAGGASAWERIVQP